MEANKEKRIPRIRSSKMPGRIHLPSLTISSIDQEAPVLEELSGSRVLTIGVIINTII